MASLNQMLERCSTGRRYIYLCLQNRTTSSDQIEILPGLKADVIIHGHPKENGRKYLPTIVSLECKDLFNYSMGDAG